jgi:DNA polymerase I
MIPTRVSDWRDLPFREIWCVDFEFYPGPGLANGGRDGDAATVCCVVGYEMRSGRYIRLWRDELGPFPPYRLDGDALFIGYTNSAEFGCHIALGWGQPACSIDPYIEFRHLVNDGSVKSGDRPRGFHSLAGALRYFGNDGIDAAHKEDMRDRIIQGPPFSDTERRAIMEYCHDDVDALAWLVPRIIPTIRSLPHALSRAQYMWVQAQQERRGVPIDLSMLDRIRSRWVDIQRDLVAEKDQPYGVYEVDEQGPHFRIDRFAAYLRRNGMGWPMLADGVTPDTKQGTFRDMTGRYPHLETLRELRYSLSKLRLNDLAVGSDGRNRTMLGAFGTKTGRNAASNSRGIFGPATWIRFLISPPPGLVLIHRDYKQQEVRIAAIHSDDRALLAACESGDVYMGVAAALGFVRDGMSTEELEAVRKLFKTVVLGIQYGAGYKSLAIRTGVSLYEAAEILNRLRARFRRFEEFTRSTLDHAGLNLEIASPMGWTMLCPSGTNPRTIRNFPMQATGADILRVACVLGERRGLSIVAPVHDAIMSSAGVSDAEEQATALDTVMQDASAVVLRGYRLPSDVQIVRPRQSFHDKRGVEMWETIRRLVAKIEHQAAAHG